MEQEGGVTGRNQTATPGVVKSLCSYALARGRVDQSPIPMNRTGALNPGMMPD